MTVSATVISKSKAFPPTSFVVPRLDELTHQTEISIDGKKATLTVKRVFEKKAREPKTAPVFNLDFRAFGLSITGLPKLEALEGYGVSVQFAN